MGLLKPARQGGYLKAGFFGSEGSGKTHTAMELAMFTRERLKLSGPIAGLDTETGINDWQERVASGTGTDLLIHATGRFDDLTPFLAECQQAGVAVAVIDSLTHLWDELCASFLGQIQATARQRRWKVPERLEFHHWSTLKSRWNEWVRAFLNAPMHVIVCGRLGAMYEMRTGDNNKREVVQVGEKFKATTFGYECRMLVKMERGEEWDPVKNEHRLVQSALVLKERWDLLTGHRAVRPRPEFFAPHIDKLDPAGHVEIPAAESTHDLDDGGRDSWTRELRRREILAQELRGILDSIFPGRSADVTKDRVETLRRFFRTSAKDQLEKRTPSEDLAQGIRLLCIERDIEIPVTAQDDGSASSDDSQSAVEPFDDELPGWMGGSAPAGEHDGQ